ncbi:kinase-like protein, partial [Lindgomyces ingoldianus]
KDDDGKFFIPVDRLDEIVTEQTIRKELKTLSVGQKKDRHTLAGQIWRAPSSKQKTTRRKIFAVLALMQKIDSILDFIEEGVYDNRLPFVYAEDQVEVCCKKTGQPIKLFQDKARWKPHEKDLFQTYQWWMMTPYFQLSCEGEKTVRRMPVEDLAVLPFTDVKTTSEGGFSVVRKVKIHSAHHNAQDFSVQPVHFAVKTLNFQADANDLENQEVQSLIRLNNENHPNLIRLLMTFQHKKHLHLVFPWADGNLQDFWSKKYPDPNYPLRDYDLARWMAQQCLGLALGLRAIHHNCVDESQAQEQGLEPDAAQKKYGKHGDFKPENILWFKQSGATSANSVTGVLKVSDFGFADFHASASKSDIPRDNVLGITPTYRAPEWDVQRNVAPSYDLWCFGCVLLEFVVWFLRGWQGVQEFMNKRLADSVHEIPGYEEDKFFNLDPHARQDIRKAVAKNSVRTEIQDLRQHEKCSDFILDLLDHVEDYLLRMRPEKRASCDNTVSVLQRIVEKCFADAKYC